MAEIGVTLREARMRAGIDIAEVESRTKIRAKYLRALENEEWSLLPGTTFVKSFLRTYAEALGLDAKLLVEEYKFRHEPYESAGIGGVAPRRPNGGGRRGRRGGGGAFGPPKRTNWLPIIVLLLLIAVALWVVYRTSKDEGEPSAPAAQTAETKAATPPKTRTTASSERPRTVGLRIAGGGTAPVYVCVADASGKRVVNGRQLQPGRRTGLLRSKSFRIALSSSKARVTRGGQRLRLKADSGGVVAYRITPEAETRLPANQRPSCR